MMGIFDAFKEKVIKSMDGGVSAADGEGRNEAMVFGALLAKVALSDGVFAPEEEAAIGKILVRELALPADELALVAPAARVAAKEKTDLRALCQEYNEISDYEKRKILVDCLYQVAAADNDVAQVEQDDIRLISNFLWLSVPDYATIRSKYVSGAGS